MNKKVTRHYVIVNKKKYFYTIIPSNERGVVVFKCAAAKIDQDFLAEDIPALLIDLPELILEEKRYQAKQKEILRFRLSAEEKKLIEKKALQGGYSSVSGFLRDVALKG